MVGTYAEAGKKDAEIAIEASYKALKGPWASMSGVERAKIILKTAQLIRENAEFYGLISTESSELLNDKSISEKFSGNFKF